MNSRPDQPAAYDAAVVGAGPAGSACATLLGRAGFRVLLCDKAVFPRHKICGETVNPRCWDSFERLGVAGQVERRLRTRIVEISVTNTRGRTLGTEIGEGDGRPFFSMGRDSLDDILAGAARTAGVEFRDGTTVVGVAWQGCWQIEVRDRERGERMSFTATHLVGADGRNSVIARHLITPQGSPGRAKRHRIDKDRVGVQWHTATDRRLAGALQLYLFDTGYCGLVDVDGAHTNVAMVTAPELAATAKTNFGSFLNKTLWTNLEAAKRFPDLTPVGEITATSPINPRRNKLRHPHATLIGDANETVEPFTGEGIRFALEDGLAFADSLVRERTGGDGGDARATGRFRVNRVFSPVLRNPGIRDGLVSLCTRFPMLSRVVAATVIPERIGKSKTRPTTEP